MRGVGSRGLCRAAGGCGWAAPRARAAVWVWLAMICCLARASPTSHTHTLMPTRLALPLALHPAPHPRSHCVHAGRGQRDGDRRGGGRARPSGGAAAHRGRSARAPAQLGMHPAGRDGCALRCAVLAAGGGGLASWLLVGMAVGSNGAHSAHGYQPHCLPSGSLALPLLRACSAGQRRRRHTRAGGGTAGQAARRRMEGAACQVRLAGWRESVLWGWPAAGQRSAVLPQAPL